MEIGAKVHTGFIASPASPMNQGEPLSEGSMVVPRRRLTMVPTEGFGGESRRRRAVPRPRRSCLGGPLWKGPSRPRVPGSFPARAGRGEAERARDHADGIADEIFQTQDPHAETHGHMPRMMGLSGCWALARTSTKLAPPFVGSTGFPSTSHEKTIPTRLRRILPGDRRR
jgi:hypothetical protein